MNYNNKTLVNIIASLVLLLGVFGLGFYVGNSKNSESDKVLSLVHKENLTAESIADFEPFWKVWNVLNEKSIHSEDVTDQDRVWGATKGLASSLGDPYTVFFSPEENKEFQEEIEGAFDGIGAEIDIKDGILTVVAPLKNTPAWSAGLKSGDKILKIDDTNTGDLSVDEAIGLIRGPKGSIVRLTIFREGEEQTREIQIIRNTIEVPALEYELKDDGIFVISFYSFSERSAVLFKEALNTFIDSGSKKMILDLRGNPGGYLDSAVSIASWFVDSGKMIVSENFNSEDRDPIIYRSRGPKLFTKDYSLVILVDQGSASASEILAGALSEYKIATLVGEKTFGKGSVQELVKITDDTSLKVTVANWYTPNGVSISLQGLEPDVKVPITIEDIKNGKDPQMSKAVEILLSK